MPFSISILVISYIKGKFTYLFDNANIRKYVYFCNNKIQLM